MRWLIEQFSPSEMKTILHSKRANMYYLEHCRVLVNGGRVEYVTEEGKKSLYWNIPIANTTSILLGTGTSITQQAVRELAKAGVLIGFCGGGGTPLLAGNEQTIEVEWFSPQSEYRPTEYLQKWVSFWFDDNKRLQAAKFFQKARVNQIRRHWLSNSIQRHYNFNVNQDQLDGLLNNFENALEKCPDVSYVLSEEAKLTKALYKLAAQSLSYGEFTRVKAGLGDDFANRFLDHGNYLAYGLGATAAWVLGLPHGLAVLHGKTRRGGLVFDIADIIKDALVLPHAFISAMAGDEEQEFRSTCIDNFNQLQALDVMIDTIKQTATELEVASQ